MAGILVGAGISALLVYLVGAFWRPGVILVAAVALVMGVGRLLRPENVAVGGFKVPRYWESWGATRYLGTFGLFLGMGFVTTMPSPTMTALILWMWHLHNLSLILITFEAFALGRISTTIMTLARRSGAPGDANSRVNAIVDRMSYLPRVEGSTSLVLGLAILLAAV